MPCSETLQINEGLNMEYKTSIKVFMLNKTREKQQWSVTVNHIFLIDLLKLLYSQDLNLNMKTNAVSVFLKVKDL